MAVAVCVLVGLARGGSTAGGDAALAGHIGVPLIVSGVVSATETPGVVVDVDRIATADQSMAAGGRVLLGGLVPVGLQVGDRVAITASALRFPGRRPGAESMEALERDGVDAIATVSSAVVVGVEQSPQRWLAVLREHVREAVDSELPEPAASLVLGVAMGIHQPIDSGIRVSLQDAGLYHIVAVSGLKVIIVLGLLAALTTLGGWLPWRRRLVGLAGVAFYVVLSGSGAAAMRSAMMAALAFAVRRDGRRLDPFIGLVGIAALLCGLEPRIAFDVGFQLSFVGTAGILLMAPVLQRRLPGPRLLVVPLAVTVAAQMATLPIIAATFGVISVVGPVANAIVLPALPLIVGLGIVGSVAAATVPAAGWLPLQLAGALSGAVVAISRVLAAIPGAAIHVGNWPGAWIGAEIGGLVVGVLVAYWLARRRLDVEWRVAVAGIAGAAVALGIAGIASLPSGAGRVTVLDVGGGEAVLMEMASGERVLVDAGAYPQPLLTALGRVLAPTDLRLDVVVVTASDPKSVGGLAGLVGHYAVGEVVVAANLTAGGQTAVEGLRQGGADVSLGATDWRWGGALWSCVTADPEHSAVGCVLRVQADAGWTVVVTGAVPSPAQGSVAVLGRSLLHADLLVSPPGGGLLPVLLDAVNPRWVAVPTVSQGKVPELGGGVTVATTGNDGDLGYTATSGAGLARD